MPKAPKLPGASLIFDGPEKAGKSTIIKKVAKQAKAEGWKVRVHKWTGPAMQDWDIYARTMEKQVARYIDRGYLLIWDRSWLSEIVYGSLLEPRPINEYWERFGFILNTITSNWGLQVCLLGPDSETLRKNRDASDLPVDPSDERKAYKEYADWFGWETFVNQHTEEYDTWLVNSILQKLDEARHSYLMYQGRAYGNFAEGKLIVVDGGFAIDNTLADRLGPAANRAAWINISALTPNHVMQSNKIVFCNVAALQKIGFIKQLPKTVSWRSVPSILRIREHSPEKSAEYLEPIKDYLL